MFGQLTEFHVEIPEAELRDLRERLERTRWPEEATVEDWSQGVPRAYLRDLCGYWAESYDWRATETRLNALPQFRIPIDGLGIHFLHVRSRHADALPLIFTHGWPGSIIEFLKVIGPLTDPTAHGGDAADAFHVVCPSLPGYGFSDKPTRPGWGVERIAAAWSVLMARLGYERYGAQGSDWGTSISASLGQQDSAHVAGIHLTPPLAPPDPATLHDLTERERAALASLEHAARIGLRLLAAAGDPTADDRVRAGGLTDGALCLDHREVQAWTDCDGHPENVLTRDELLDNLMLYWLPRTGASSARLYWESIGQVNEWITGSARDTVAAPTGCSIFPKELQRPSRRWAEKRFLDIRYWNEPARGGHFAAFEQPELFVEEVRSFFRLVR
jgi:epoxide hydrolase